MKALLSFLGCTLLLVCGCTDPITVGSDLLSDDRATVGQTTELTFTTRVVREDSFLVFATPPYTPPLPFTFGRIDDVNFGLTDHSVYLTPRLPRSASTGLVNVPLFAQRVNITVDSVVVILPIDTLRGFYGPGREFPYRATQIASAVSFRENFYSDFSAPTLGIDYAGDGRFTASRSSIEVRDTAINGGRSFARPHARLKLNDAFVQLANGFQEADFATDSLFRERFAGLYIQSTAPSNALLNIAPNENRNIDTVYNGFNFYYRDTTGRPAEYRVLFLQAIPSYRYEYGSSFAGTLLNGPADSSLLAVAGRGGLMTELTFDNLDALRNRVINQAELTVPVANIEGLSYTDYPLPPRVELFYRRSSDNLLVPIIDREELLRARASDASTTFFLGGGLKGEATDRFYTTAFTVHLQRMIDGEVPNRLYLRVYPTSFASAISPARALLNGPGAAERPARVTVTFTNLD